MPVDQESAAVAFARAHAEAWSNYDWAKAREGLAADIYVTATTTLPAARLYLFDEDDKIKAEQIAFFAEPGFRSSGWITGGHQLPGRRTGEGVQRASSPRGRSGSSPPGYSRRRRAG